MRQRRARPDAEVRRLLLQLALVRGPGPRHSVEAVRRDWQLAVKAFGSREEVARVVERQVPGPAGPLTLRAYVPLAAPSPSPALVWFHGGGFIFGDLYTAGATSRALAKFSGAVVVAIRYRLAPEHSLQDALDDCRAGLRWVAENGHELGIDTDRLAVGGDSAGGGLAALVAQREAHGGVRLAAQLLVYPATELTGKAFPSASEDMPGLLDEAWTSWIRSKLAHVTDVEDPELSAVSASDLAGVAPAIVLTAGFDPLRDEGLHYADQLRRNGVPVRLLHFPGQIHGFLSLDRVLAGGRYALWRIGCGLAEAFEHGIDPGIEDDLPRARLRDRARWISPAQRLHELKVTSIVVRERVSRARRVRRARTRRDTVTLPSEGLQ